MLGVLTDRYDMTRTNLAERLLETATEVVWRAAGFEDLSETQINAIEALTKPHPSSAADLPPGKAAPDRSLAPPTPASSQTPSQDERENILPDRTDCFTFIFRKLGIEMGKIRKTVAVSRNGSTRVCCLVSKNYNAEKPEADGERYWFTIYERHLEDIEQAQHGYVAFASGSAQQIVLVPVSTFREWCASLPPYTQGNTGWHVHLSKISGTWNLRREGYHTSPIDVTSFVI